MANITSEIKQQKITTAEFHIADLDKIKKFQLKVEMKTQIREPKDPKDLTALLMQEVSIKIPDHTKFNIKLIAEFIFEFNEIPCDYGRIGREVCTPKARDTIFEKIDEFLITMGYDPFHLAQHTPDSITIPEAD